MIFTEVEQFKTIFNVFEFCLLQKQRLQILTISLFISIRLISCNVLMKKEGPYTKFMQ